MAEPLETPGFRAVAEFLIADRRNVEGLAEADRRLAVLACLLAVDPACIDVRLLFKEALSSDVSPLTLEIALVHAIGYLGAIRVGAAYRQLGDELAEAGLAHAVIHDTAVESDRQTRVDNGVRLYDRFDPGRQAQQARMFAALSPDYYPRAMELSGLVLQSPYLALRERQIMTVAMLACLGGQADQLRFHIGVALRNGVSRETLAGIFIVVQAYAGMPRANSAASLALAVLNDDHA